MKYALELNSNSGYGIVYLENNENSTKVDCSIRIGTYEGFYLPDTVDEPTTLYPH